MRWHGVRTNRLPSDEEAFKCGHVPGKLKQDLVTAGREDRGMDQRRMVGHEDRMTVNAAC